MKKKQVFLFVIVLVCSVIELAPQQKTEKKPKRQRVVSRLTGFELAGGESVNKDAIRGGATRGNESLVALAPDRGLSLSGTPTFYWRTPRPAAKQTVVVLEGARKVYEASVTGATFTYPASAPALERGKDYSWFVQLKTNDLDTESSVPVQIQIVEEQAANALSLKLNAVQAGDARERQMARTKALIDARLWYDAMDALNRSIVKSPERADLYELRGTVYGQISVTAPESEADFKRADSLSSSRKPR